MRYQFYREHKYVSAALNDLERLIAQTDFCDESSLETVKQKFKDLSNMLKGHAGYENERLHALLKQKEVSAAVYQHVEEDHAKQDGQLEDIEKLMHQISSEEDSDKKIELGYQLYLLYRKFVADNLSHLHEEETQILTHLQKLYSDSELRQVEARSYREMTPDQIVHMIQVLFPHMNIHDKKAFLTDIQILEPSKFEAILPFIESLFTASEMALISARF